MYIGIYVVAPEYILLFEPVKYPAEPVAVPIIEKDIAGAAAAVFLLVNDMFFTNGIPYKDCPPTNPYQEDPPFRVIKENMSRLFTRDVRVGAVADGHKMISPHVTERGVPSAVNISVNADEPAV
jgi:hypothetical protein